MQSRRRGGGSGGGDRAEGGFGAYQSKYEYMGSQKNNTKERNMHSVIFVFLWVYFANCLSGFFYTIIQTSYNLIADENYVRLFER